MQFLMLNGRVELWTLSFWVGVWLRRIGAILACPDLNHDVMIILNPQMQHEN